MRRAWCAVLWLSAAGVTATTACTDERALTEEQRAVLLSFKLPEAPPPDPSNAYADDARAAVLGKKWFFDRRLSGPLGTDNDGVTNGSLGPPNAEGRISCADCHDPMLGGSDHRSRPPATSLGANYSGRNAQSVLNAAYIDLAKGAWQTCCSCDAWGCRLRCSSLAGRKSCSIVRRASSRASI